MSDIFREVDEEVRREQWFKLWRTHGKHVIAAASAAAVVVAGSIGWIKYQEYRRTLDSEQFAAAGRLVAEDRPALAAERFERLAGDAHAGYAALAKLRAADALAAEGERAAAVDVLDRLAADDGADRSLRQLAALHAVYLLVDSADPAALERRLAPLLADDSPWRNSARELSGLIALRRGDTARAREIFAALTEDSTAPFAVRSRAAELLATLRAGAISGG